MVNTPGSRENASQAPATERALRQLMKTVRSGSPRSPADIHRYWGTVPDDLAETYGVPEEQRGLYLTGIEEERFSAAVRAVQQDWRFEHMNERKAKESLWRFICLSHFDHGTNHVTWFLSSYGKEPMESVSYFPTQYLLVTERLTVAGVEFIPLDDPEVPEGWSRPDGSSVGGVVAVAVAGTSLQKMRDRARAKGDHALRLLRVGLRAHPSVHDMQLRFRLADAYEIRKVGRGWTRSEETASELGLDRELYELLVKQPLATLPTYASTGVDRRALIALNWLDRARLATDDITRTLFDFFALEALLGDRSEGEKGLALTFRRSLLGLADGGGFSSPGRLFYLYDQVRSSAVHGENPPVVDPRDYSTFDWDARRALNQFLAFARNRGLRSRTDVIAALEGHPEALALLENLREADPRWRSFEPRGISKAAR
jgi:hypothetical protein